MKTIKIIYLGDTVYIYDTVFSNLLGNHFVCSVNGGQFIPIEEVFLEEIFHDSNVYRFIIEK